MIKLGVTRRWRKFSIQSSMVKLTLILSKVYNVSMVKNSRDEIKLAITKKLEEDQKAILAICKRLWCYFKIGDR